MCVYDISSSPQSRSQITLPAATCILSLFPIMPIFTSLRYVWVSINSSLGTLYKSRDVCLTVPSLLLFFLSPGNFTAWHIYSCKKEFIENVVGVGASAQWTRSLLHSCTLLHHFMIALSVNIYVFVLWCVEACKKPRNWLRRLSFVVSKTRQFYQNFFLSISHTKIQRRRICCSVLCFFSIHVPSSHLYFYTLLQASFRHLTIFLFSNVCICLF